MSWIRFSAVAARYAMLSAVALATVQSPSVDLSLVALVSLDSCDSFSLSLVLIVRSTPNGMKLGLSLAKPH